MKAILEFDLDNPDDRGNHLIATQSTDWVLTVWDLSQELRSLLDNHKFKSADEALEGVLSKLFEIMDKRHITLETIS